MAIREDFAERVKRNEGMSEAGEKNSWRRGEAGVPAQQGLERTGPLVLVEDSSGGEFAGSDKKDYTEICCENPPILRQNSWGGSHRQGIAPKKKAPGSFC